MSSLFTKILSIVVGITWLMSCTPQDEILAGKPQPVTFSEDAIVFDTVFTALPTVSRYFHIRNPNKNAVLIRSFRLGDAASPYQITIGGRPQAAARNIQLRGGDSLLVLVKINIPARNLEQPFALYDSLMVDMPDAVSNIKLLAWGQDAVFVKQTSLSGNQTWQAGKPYIIYDSVTVLAGSRLTIQPGARIFAFNGAALVIDGSLQANGTADAPVVFSGFRQDGAYRQVPGVWRGLSFRRANQNSVLNFVQIRNATNAIHIDSPDNDTQPDLLIQNTIIQYARQAGILAIAADVHVTNTRITHCGEYLFAGLGGGNYRLWHCTLVSEFYLIKRESPALLFTNYVKINGADRQNALTCEVKNTVVWGALSEEVGFIQNTATVFTTTFLNNLLKSAPNATVYNSSNLLGTAPSFTDTRRMNFGPATASPLVDAGINLGVTTDITGKPRDTKPDIGAYEL